MSTDFFESYGPTTPTEFWQPVLDDDATGGLTGVETPDGHGFLVWSGDLSATINYTTLATPMSWLANDTVSSWSTLLTADVVYGSNAIISNGELLVAVAYNTDNTFYLEVYVADDPNTPTSFTLLDTPYTSHAGGAFFGIINNTSPSLLRLDSGRLLLGSKTADGPSNNAFQAVHVRIFTSDDFGASWTQRMDFEHPNLFPRTEYASSTFALDPISNDIWWRSGTGISATDMNDLWRSQNSGLSWSHSTSDISYLRFWPAVHNDTHVYSFVQDGSMYVYSGNGGIEFTDWDFIATTWAAPGVTFDDVYSSTVKVVIASQGMFIFLRDQVMFLRGGITPGFAIPLLHIPFKDRLMNVTEREVDDGRR